MATEGSRFFFSYAREDSEIVLRLARELRKAGANLWLDQLDIRGGQRWDESVQAALESCQGMVAVLSPSAVASQNFLDEVSYALEERKQVIPLLYRECAIPFRLRRVQYVNFTVSYDDGFAELLRSMGLEIATETAVLPVIGMGVPIGSVQPEISEEKQRDETVVEREVIRQVEQVPPENEPEQDRGEPEKARDQAQEEPRGQVAVSAAEKPLATVESRRVTPRQRRIAACIGAVTGSIVGALAVLLETSISLDDLWLGALISGISGAIVGAITGTNWRLIRITFIVALGGAVAEHYLDPSPWRKYGFTRAIIFGGSFGALLGAVAGVALKRLKVWS